MKTEAFLSIVAIALAFAAGLLVLSIKYDSRSAVSTPVWQTALQKFESSKTPVTTLKWRRSAQFLDPQNQLPTWSQMNLAEARGLNEYARTCKGAGGVRSQNFAKAWILQDYLCGRSDLPARFLERPPFFHPSGASYAFLVQNRRPLTEAELAFVHVLELPQIRNVVLDSENRIFSQLQWPTLFDLSHEEKLILDPAFVLIRNHDDQGAYKIFQRREWDRYWQSTPYHAEVTNAQDGCFVRQASLCWSYTPVFLRDWNILTVLFTVTSTLTLLMLGLLVRRIRRRQRDEHRLQFALEMLAHEIRTPLTGLALNAEDLRTDFDSLSEKNQTLTLRMFDQIERLKRVVDSSRMYLRKNLGPAIIETQFREVESVREFVEYALQQYLEQVELHIVDNVRPIKMDSYWTGVCIKNAVENAIRHGVRPVRVTVQPTEAGWTFQVEDQGQESFDPGQKSQASSGLGIGFRLIREVLPYLNARMTLQHAPTRVNIHFSRMP